MHLLTQTEKHQIDNKHENKMLFSNELKVGSDLPDRYFCQAVRICVGVTVCVTALISL